jgi:TusA-related sulfurtransferase
MFIYLQIPYTIRANLNGYKIVNKLDLRGLYCPEPVFRTKVAVDALQVGEVIEVIADDPASEEDIPRWVNRVGHIILSVQKNGKDIHFLIKKVK